MNIKKIILITTICLLSSISLLAKDIPFFTFSLGLTSGHIIYGENEYEFSYEVPLNIENPENIDITENQEKSDSSKDPLSNENEDENNNSEQSSITEPVENTDSTTENQIPEPSDVPASEDTSPNDTISDNTTTTEPVEDSVNTEEKLTEEKTIYFPMKFQNGNEALIGVTGTACLNLTSFFSLYTDLDCMADLNWLGTDYSHHLDCSFATGAKIYVVPNVQSISISIAYLFGTRIDFFKYEDFSLIRNTPFGNGIKISAEYSFARDGNYKFLPTIGCSWKYIPRGNYHADNIITAYAQVNFY